jgi:RimJ/RimL family protein N-acetyltransferase
VGGRYAAEAARAALGCGFTTAGLAEIVSFAAAANLRSERARQRLGMTHDPAEDFDHRAS